MFDSDEMITRLILIASQSKLTDEQKTELDKLLLDEQTAIICPWHNEKTPSCVIHKSTKHVHCFSCEKDFHYE